MVYTIITILWLIIIKLCFGAISCESGYIEAKTRRWKTNITSCIHPSTEEEIVNIVLNAVDAINIDAIPTTVRAIGASISYSGVGMLDEYNFYSGQKQDVIVLNTTSNMTDVIHIDLDSLTMTFQSGLRVQQVLQTLYEYNLTLPYIGGSTISNFVGWIMTGTHGSGSLKNEIKPMANNVIGLRMVIGNGSVIEMNETYNTDLLNAALISFGSLGIVTEITVKAIPIDPGIGSRSVDSQFLNLTNMELISDILRNEIIPTFNNYEGGKCEFRFFEDSWWCWLEEYYNITTNLTNLSNMNIAPDTWYLYGTLTGYNYDYAGNRRPEIELFVPYEVFADAQIAVIQYILQQKRNQTKLWNQTYSLYMEYDGNFDFFTPFRYVGGDDLWLSPSGLGNDTMMVQIGIYFDEHTPYWLFNEWILPIHDMLLDRFGIIHVHWGKISMSGYCKLKDSYSKLNDFKILREEFDPFNIFLNSFTIDKLGLCSDNLQCCCSNYTCQHPRIEDKPKEDDWITIIIICSIILGAILLIVVAYYCYKNKLKFRGQNKENELSTLLT